MDKLQEARLLETALAALKPLGLAAELVHARPKRAQTRADGLVRIGRDGVHGHTYAVEVKRGLRPATLGAAVHELERRGEPVLLVADHVTPAMADTLRTRRIPFIDAAGNAYLDQPGFLVWVAGRKPPAPVVPAATGRAFQPTGLQVVFTLLCIPEAIEMPYRDLAALAGVAHGTVGWVLDDLEHQGFVAKLTGKRGKRRLFRRGNLLVLWADAYARLLRPRLLLARYFGPSVEGWKKWPLEGQDGAVWGEEPAGALLTNYLRPGALVIYARKIPPVLVARERLAKAAEAGRTAIVEFRGRFWAFKDDAERRHVAPPVLVYADLLATGDARCIETAKQVYEEHVVRLLGKD